MVRLLRSPLGDLSFVLEGTQEFLRATLKNAYQFATYQSLFRRCGLNDTALDQSPFRAFQRLTRSVKKDYISLQRDSLGRVGSRQFVTDWTSGSTAKPILRISSPRDEDAEAEAARRAFQSVGVNQQDRVVCFDVGASDIYLFYGRVLAGLGLAGSCFVKASRRYGVSTHAIARTRPTVIISLPSVLRRCLADLTFEKKGAPDWNLRRLIYIGEAMDARLKREIHKQLGAACLSFYGTTEVGSVGIECERSGGIHIPLDLLVPTLLPLEGQTVRRVSPGLYEGVVAWTSLRFRDHPVVKYCVGDVVRISTVACPCGNPLPTMHFERRLDHTFSFFGIKFTYDLFLESIQEALGRSANLEVRVCQATSRTEKDEPSQISFVLEECHRPYVKRCEDAILAIHPIEDFVERGLLRISFRFVPAKYFHRRKNRRAILVRPKKEET